MNLANWKSQIVTSKRGDFVKNVVVKQVIEEKIYLIRGKRVMLDRDLAALYGVPNKVLNQAVKRHLMRFPKDFMFQLTAKEMQNWKSQIVTSKSDKMGLRKRLHAFTEQGVAMLSSVLNSERAVQVNIQIMRTFTKFRQMLQSNTKLRQKIEEMERKYDHQFKVVFQAIKQLLIEEQKPKSRIGFHP